VEGCCEHCNEIEGYIKYWGENIYIATYTYMCTYICRHTNTDSVSSSIILFLFLYACILIVKKGKVVLVLNSLSTMQ
jgi:hypothetical protein